MLPPRLVRRAVIAPSIPLATLLLVTSLPLLALGAAAVSPRLPGRLRPLRLLWFLLVFLTVESLGVLATLALWVRHGFGRRLDTPAARDAHYTLMRWYLAVIVGTAERTFHLDVVLEGEPAGQLGQLGPPGTPLLVLSRHAGPGDSFLLVHELLQRGYRPRVVLKESLRWAPCLDIALGRLPAHFVGAGAASGGADAVARLAADMGAGDALVVFPEGGNFTPGRRTRSIAKLEELGDHEAADLARELRHVLTPRTGGTLAAIRAAPRADVVFVAHTGLEQLSGLVDLWRGLPMDAVVEARAWRVPAGQLPRDEVAGADWLFAWWRRIDAWIVRRRGTELVPDAVVDALTGSRPPNQRSRGHQVDDGPAPGLDMQD